MSADRDKTPEQIREEARRELADIQAERQRQAILKDAQNREDQQEQGNG